MARYTGPVCKLCRREGTKLYLKGDRCFSEKCSVGRRPYPPGQHGQARIKLSEFGIRLREKQKMRRVYGVLEDQFRGYFQEASRRKGRTGELMLGIIEQRLDSVIYRSGFAASRSAARLLVRHGHVKINGKRVDIPSYQVRVNDKLELTEKAKLFGAVLASVASADSRPQVTWIEADRAKLIATLKSAPARDELNEPEIKEQLIVEYYSR